MTTTVYWLPELRGCIQSSKRRSIRRAVRSAQPQSGTPFFSRTGSGEREEWSFDLIFSYWQAQRFESWLNEYGRDWFYMPIETETGYYLMDVHFTNDGFPTAKNERVWEYSASVVVRGKIDLVTHDYVPITHDGDYITHGN